jgi:hypothetical protein
MPKQDAASILDEILGEADALIRQRLKDRGLEMPLYFGLGGNSRRPSLA